MHRQDIVIEYIGTSIRKSDTIRDSEIQPYNVAAWFLKHSHCQCHLILTANILLTLDLELLTHIIVLK